MFGLHQFKLGFTPFSSQELSQSILFASITSLIYMETKRCLNLLKIFELWILFNERKKCGCKIFSLETYHSLYVESSFWAETELLLYLTCEKLIILKIKKKKDELHRNFCFFFLRVKKKKKSGKISAWNIFYGFIFFLFLIWVFFFCLNFA